jgi:hypothetical protein
MDLKPVIRWLENGCDPKEAATELRLYQHKISLPKAEKLTLVGLGHNPCQGCEAYYTRDGLGYGCAAEVDGRCEWIKLHDAALAV